MGRGPFNIWNPRYKSSPYCEKLNWPVSARLKFLLKYVKNRLKFGKDVEDGYVTKSNLCFSFLTQGLMLLETYTTVEGQDLRARLPPFLNIGKSLRVCQKKY